MLKRITLASLVGVCLISIGCAGQQPQTVAKRVRPATSSYRQYNENTLVSFMYPPEWEVKAEGDNILLIDLKDKTNSADPVQIKLKIWPALSDVDLDQFKQVVTPVDEYLGENRWQVFRDFPGVYTLDLWFLPYKGAMLEVDSISTTDANYAPQTQTIIRSITTK